MAVSSSSNILIVLEALSFLCFALLHVGVRIPLGFAVIEEPRRPFAVIVEGLAAVLLALAASAVLTRTTRAWWFSAWACSCC